MTVYDHMTSVLQQSLRLIYTEQQKPPQTARNGAFGEIMSAALKKLQMEALTVHTSPFNRMEKKRLRIRVHLNVEKS